MRASNRAPRLLAISALAWCGVAGAAGGHVDPATDRGLAEEVDAYLAADRTEPPTPCQVLFVGSSSIVRWKSTLASDMAPLPTLNRGFGGSQIAHVNRWFDELVARNKPRSIVLYAGDNDIGAGSTSAEVVAEFDAFMALKSRALGPTPVYFVSVKPSKARLSQLPEQTRVNDAIRARASRRADLHYIDVVTPMMDRGRLRDIYEADGLHMTRRGYEIWADVIRPVLLVNARGEELACQRVGRE